MSMTKLDKLDTDIEAMIASAIPNSAYGCEIHQRRISIGKDMRKCLAVCQICGHEKIVSLYADDPVSPYAEIEEDAQRVGIAVSGGELITAERIA